MTDIAELGHDPVSTGESKEAPTPFERQIRNRQKGSRRDDKSMDRLMRLIIALSPTRHPILGAGEEYKEISEETKPNPPGVYDLVHVHVFGSAIFGDNREHTRKILQQILSHPALQPLDEAAKFVASTYIFQGHSAYRLKTDGKYWVLGDIGEAYPYPLAIRTGAFPSWKNQIRSLEKLAKKLRKSASQALRLEADSIVSSRPEQMPAELIFDAETALRKAINWMQTFPSPVNLRSKYRRIVKADPAEESVRVVAYVLDRLYREHPRESSLKVKEIECRIAELETTFFGQSIQYDPDFGCPAVRLQIRAVKRSKFRTAVDRRLLNSFKMINRKLEEERRNDPSRVNAAFDQLLKRLDRHDKAYDAWHDGTKSRLDEGLRRTLEATTYADEGFEAGEEYLRQMRNHLDLCKRWHEEYSGHLDALKSPNLDFWEYSKVLQKWMKSWESLWDFPM